MRLIGLTGGIASGKSTVRQMLAALGATVLDADAIYHELIAPKDGAASELAQTLGRCFTGVLMPDGQIDRRRLGEQVFSNAGERAALEAITHPAIASEVARRMHAFSQAGTKQVIYDVPLLYERGLERGMDGVIVVWAPPDVQLERLMLRAGIERAAAEQRIATQMSLDEKRQRATWVIDNSGTRESSATQTRNVWREIQAPARR